MSDAGDVWDGRERRGDMPLVLSELRELKKCQQETTASIIRMETRFDELWSKAVEHHSTLYGNGGKLGLDKDVDRLKQQSRTVGWFLATAWMAILGGLVKLVTGK